MANDLGCHAVLSDILACLTYKPSKRLSRVRLRALDMWEHLGVGSLEHERSRPHPLSPLMPIQRLPLVKNVPVNYAMRYSGLVTALTARREMSLMLILFVLALRATTIS